MPQQKDSELRSSGCLPRRSPSKQLHKEDSSPGVHHVFSIDLPTSLGRKVVGVVLVLLLLLSGDIETNPGPVGEFLC